MMTQDIQTNAIYEWWQLIACKMTTHGKIKMCEQIKISLNAPKSKWNIAQLPYTCQIKTCCISYNGASTICKNSEMQFKRWSFLTTI